MPIALFIAPPCKAPRNTSDVKAASPPSYVSVRSLDPFRALRELTADDGTKERPSPPNKELSATAKQRKGLSPAAGQLIAD
jgi:hypothetical protein